MTMITTAGGGCSKLDRLVFALQKTSPNQLLIQLVFYDGDGGA